MTFFSNPWALVLLCAALSLAALTMVRGRITVDGFFAGQSEQGEPSLYTLVLSQVTTWIFARSLMNAAILGYFYGFAGSLAYSCYYISFLTGGVIVTLIRNGGASSIQDWLGRYFGQIGKNSYNLIIALRLLSEVFANLIVIGLIFSALFPDNAETVEIVAIITLAIAGLAYSMQGGLSASLKTDVLQMLVFLVVFLIALLLLVSSDGFSLSAALQAQGVHAQGARPGWVLVAVAFLQVFSYPAHDPVMMDRGFIANPAKTRASFILAFALSVFCILGFGLFGIHAGIVGADYDTQLIGTWRSIFGPFVFFLLMASLVVSAISTLDSAMSASARLVIEELQWGQRNLRNGRLAMLVFMVLGTVLTLFPNKTLFDAVAVTGTASMFLTPVLIFSFIGLRVPIWSYLVAWFAAVGGAGAYMFRGTELVQTYVNGAHKYDQLLQICIAVLLIGFLACALGALGKAKKA